MSGAMAIDIQQLIIGRDLTAPIYDMQGVLLLAAGCPITADQKRRLVTRGVQRVLVSEVDVPNVVLETDPAQERQLAALEERINSRIDAMVRSGQMNVVNTGPAVKNQVVRHGRKAYDGKLQETLVRERRENAGVVDQLMTGVLRGEVNSRRVSSVADWCIQSLAADIDGTLNQNAAQNRDPSIAEHSLNVATLGMAIGIDLGLDVENVRRIGIAGLLQDMGMSQVPRDILHAPRRLTPSEFVDVQKHVVRTANYLERVRGIPSLVQLVAYQVHERMDGSGYPRQREGTGIHLFARILHVADCYTAMTAIRPFRPPLMPYAAMVCLLRQSAERKVDPDVVRALLRVLALFPIGSLVTLSDGSVAKVMRANGEAYAQPIVLRLRNAHGQPVNLDDDAAIVDLSRSELRVVQALPTPGRHELPFTDDILTLTDPAHLPPSNTLPQFLARSSEKRAPHIVGRV